MTTTVQTRRAHDTRHATRMFAALILPIGPAVVGVLRLVLPYTAVEDQDAVVRAVTENQATQSLVVWLGLVAVLTLIPAVLWVGRLTRRGAPRITAVALLLLVPGYVSLLMLVASDAAVLFAVREGLDATVAAEAYTAQHPAFTVAGVLFVIGHVLGTVLLGVAMWQSGVVPRWAAAATIASQPLHFVAAVILGSPGLDFFAWGLNAVGFAAASVAILAMSDDDWDLAPVRS